MIELAKIRTDGGTQSRAFLNAETVDEYAQAMAEPETVFPPVVVYFDGRDYWLADGFHRVAAWEKIGRTEIPAEVRQGDKRAAILHSCGANAAHGLRRTNADKRRAVQRLLEDDEWAKWADREIAEKCRVSHPFVAKLRSGLTGNVTSEDQRTYTTKHGTEAQMDTSRIGKKPVQKSSGGPGVDNTGISVADAADGPAPKREGLSGLSREGLEEEVTGLRAENDELRDKVTNLESEVRDLSQRLAEATADNQGAVISKLQKQLGTAKYQRDEANTAARRAEYKARQAVKERDKALREMSEQVINL